MNSSLEQIFPNCALIVIPGAYILNDGASFGGKLPALCGDRYTSMDAANLYVCGSCKVQRVLRHRYGINGRGTELQLHRGSQSTLNQFCGTEGGMEGIRWDRGGQYSQHSRGPHHLPMQCHPLMKRPSCSLLLLSFKHVSRLLAV